MYCIICFHFNDCGRKCKSCKRNFICLNCINKKNILSCIKCSICKRCCLSQCVNCSLFVCRNCLIKNICIDCEFMKFEI